MSHRSPVYWMEGSDYEDKCGQQADDMGRMSNCEKRNDKSEKKRIGANHNNLPVSPSSTIVSKRIKDSSEFFHRDQLTLAHAFKVTGF